MILHRSLMFVPGSREEMVEKSSRFPADVLCLDLEEAVPPEEKSRARTVVREAIGPLHVMERAVYVRLNSIQSAQTRDDLAAVVRPGLAGVVLAKTESAQAVRDVDVLLREQELANDVRPGTVELVVAIESARALLACEAISHASTRLGALMLGGEDFTFDMGVERTAKGDELSHARSVIATCARAAGLVALDTPWASIEDIDGLRADAQRAKGLGFGGKFVIHPDQIDHLLPVLRPVGRSVPWHRELLPPKVWGYPRNRVNSNQGRSQEVHRQGRQPLLSLPRRQRE